MGFKVYSFEGGAMTVHYEAKRCSHAKAGFQASPDLAYAAACFSALSTREP